MENPGLLLQLERAIRVHGLGQTVALARDEERKAAVARLSAALLSSEADGAALLQNIRTNDSRHSAALTAKALAWIEDEIARTEA